MDEKHSLSMFKYGVGSSMLCAYLKRKRTMNLYCTLKTTKLFIVLWKYRLSVNALPQTAGDM